MRKKLQLILILMVCVVAVGCRNGGGDENGLIEDASRGLVWRVSPSLPYDEIHFCACGRFFDRPIGNAIDPATGLLTDEYHNGHGPGMPRWVYDPALGLFGHGSSSGYHTTAELHLPDNRKQWSHHAHIGARLRFVLHLVAFNPPLSDTLLCVQPNV